MKEASPINYTVNDLEMPKIKGSDVAIIVDALRHGEKSFPNASKRDSMRRLEREIKDANEGKEHALSTSTDLKFSFIACLDEIAGELEAVDPRLAMALDQISDRLEGREAGDKKSGENNKIFKE